MNTEPLTKLMEQDLLIAAQFEFTVEDNKTLTQIVSGITHGRDKTGEYVIARFLETAENYEYLHNFFGKELTIGLKHVDFKGENVFTRIEGKKVRWVEEHTDLSYSSDCLCELVVRLEFL